MDDQWKNLFKKLGITARKHNGDDAYSWTVFVKGQERMGGLSKGEVNYYKRQIAKSLVKNTALEVHLPK